jgi:hypothetical protein
LLDGLAELLLGKRPPVLGRAADQLEFQLLMDVLGQIVIAGHVGGERELGGAGPSEAPVQAVGVAAQVKARVEGPRLPAFPVGGDEGRPGGTQLTGQAVAGIGLRRREGGGEAGSLEVAGQQGDVAEQEGLDVGGLKPS